MIENREKWVAALRSGRYEQGTRYLNADGALCCLGVACEVYDDAANPLKVESKGGLTIYDGEDCHLPSKVAAWLGFDSTNDANPILGGVAATYRNDAMGESFEQIADAIEADL